MIRKRFTSVLLVGLLAATSDAFESSQNVPAGPENDSIRNTRRHRATNLVVYHSSSRTGMVSGSRFSGNGGTSPIMRENPSHLLRGVEHSSLADNWAATVYQPHRISTNPTTVPQHVQMHLGTTKSNQSVADPGVRRTEDTAGNPFGHFSSADHVVGSTIGSAYQSPSLNRSSNSNSTNHRQIQLRHPTYLPSYARHPHYRGSWNFAGIGPQTGGDEVSRNPQGWGLGAWGLGAIAYDSGYLNYANPYFDRGRFGLYGNYNYSRPVPVSYSNPIVGPGTIDANSCQESLTAAVGSLKHGNEDAALDLISRALILCPDDAVLHEFRSLVLFATGDYLKSAATIHSVLAVGPGWNWPTMCGMYDDMSIYTAQLRRLEKFKDQHPMDSAVRFLLAYHYLVCGYPDASASQLRQVVELEPNDCVAADLLRWLSKQPAATVADVDRAPTPVRPESVEDPSDRLLAKAMDRSLLTRSWVATRADGAKFTMAINVDSSFRWTFDHKGRSSEFSGIYTCDGSVLTLENKSGGSLVVELQPIANGGFNFKLLGAPIRDTGLNFFQATH